MKNTIRKILKVSMEIIALRLQFEFEKRFWKEMEKRAEKLKG